MKAILLIFLTLFGPVCSAQFGSNSIFPNTYLGKKAFDQNLIVHDLEFSNDLSKALLIEYTLKNANYVSINTTFLHSLFDHSPRPLSFAVYPPVTAQLESSSSGEMRLGSNLYFKKYGRNKYVFPNLFINMNPYKTAGDNGIRRNAIQLSGPFMIAAGKINIRGSALILGDMSDRNHVLQEYASREGRFLSAADIDISRSNKWLTALSNFTVKNYSESSHLGKHLYQGREQQFIARFSLSTTNVRPFQYWVQLSSRIDKDHQRIDLEDIQKKLRFIHGIGSKVLWRVNEYLGLTGDARLDYHSHFKFLFSPALLIQFRKERLNMSALLRKHYAEPNIISDNRYYLCSPRQILIKNNDFMESSWHYSLTGAYSFGGLNLQLATAFIQYQNKLLVDSWTDPSKYVFRIAGKGVTQYSTDISISKEYRIFSSLLMYRYDRYRNGENRQLDFYPLHNLFTEIGFKNKARNESFLLKLRAGINSAMNIPGHSVPPSLLMGIHTSLKLGNIFPQRRALSQWSLAIGVNDLFNTSTRNINTSNAFRYNNTEGFRTWIGIYYNYKSTRYYDED